MFNKKSKITKLDIIGALITVISVLIYINDIQP